jgi:Na+/proline symporter
MLCVLKKFVLQIFYMAIVMYAPATALNGLTGINLQFLIAVSGVLCTFYTAVGGLKAVVWTDAFQVNLHGTKI